MMKGAALLGRRSSATNFRVAAAYDNQSRAGISLILHTRILVIVPHKLSCLCPAQQALPCLTLLHPGFHSLTANYTKGVVSLRLIFNEDQTIAFAGNADVDATLCGSIVKVQT